jgi:phage-related protein
VQGYYCPWVFKGSECGYQGGVTVCDYTYPYCSKLFGKTTPKRFGGFLGMPERSLAAY